MKYIILSIVVAIFLIGWVQCDSVIVENSNSTAIRAFEAVWYPSVDPRIIQLTGVSLDRVNRSAEYNAVQFTMEDYNQTAVVFGYFTEQVNIDTTGNWTDIASATFAFALQAGFMIEYVDMNGIAGFQPNSTDQLTGLYNLSDIYLEWKPMQINSTELTDSEGNTFKVWFVTIQTVDEVFLMRFIVGGAPIQVSNVELTPEQMKIDFEINWFTDLHVRANWTSGPSNADMYPHAQVALIVAMAAGAETFNANTGGSGSNNASFEFGAAGYTGFFTWEQTVNCTVQGEQTVEAVYAEVQTGENFYSSGQYNAEWLQRSALFSFGGYRPASVVWDPVLGLKPQTASVNTTATKHNAAGIMLPAMALIASILAFFF